ncbi:uncharacterized protein LOC124162066 [Ischnura elegans]|uniref:uncharacterized protein LOC124162066 n=1 Tax=Ischnura elegans TaxID=197161 RepID=UPI001ED87518|nr:uncharacterized protein LOC124162066 [Ischnura elegans]
MSPIGEGYTNNNYEGENESFREICGGTNEHVSIVEIDGQVSDLDIDSRKPTEGKGFRHGHLPDRDRRKQTESRAIDESGRPYQSCKCNSSIKEANVCLCVTNNGSTVNGGSKCDAPRWSDRVSKEDSEYYRNREQRAVNSERDDSEQCPYASERKDYPETNESRLDIDTQTCFLDALIEGKDVPLDAAVSMDSQPEWLDREKMDRGRKFALRYLLAVVYAEMVSLALLLTMKGSIQALVFTGKSHTPLTAFKRYMSTVLRVISWYEGDILRKEGDAQNNMKIVRNMHASVSRRMNSGDREELLGQMTLEGRGIGILSSQGKPIQTDYEESVGKLATGCPFAGATSLSRGGLKSGCKFHLNQLELSITQFGFMGLIVLFPEKFGAHGASQEDLEAFVHLWRVLGHYLGIKEKYNFCSGDLQETRQRCRLVLDKWMKPIMSEASREWEHMYRCVVKGTRYYVVCNTYGGSLLYLSWLLGVNTPRLLSASSWFERLLFKVQKITFCYFCKMYWVTAFINWLLRIAIWRGRKLATVWYESLEKKANRRYEKKEKGMSTRL